MESTRNLSGAKTLRASAALLLIGGPLLGLLFGSLEMAALAFGFGAAHLGLGQLWASEHRGGRFIGVTFVLVGGFSAGGRGAWVLTPGSARGFPAIR